MATAQKMMFDLDYYVGIILGIMEKNLETTI